MILWVFFSHSLFIFAFSFMCPNMTYSVCVCVYIARGSSCPAEHWPAGWSRSFRVIILWACMPLSLLRLNLIYISKTAPFFFSLFIFRYPKFLYRETVRHRARVYTHMHRISVPNIHVHLNRENMTTSQTTAQRRVAFHSRTRRWPSTCHIPYNTVDATHPKIFLARCKRMM